MQRTCVKCGHDNMHASGAADEACPSCGAIYAKASATSARPVTRAAQPTQSGSSGFSAQSGFGGSSGFSAQSGFGGNGGGRRRGGDDQIATPSADYPQFVATMRAQSLYPTVRTLVKLGHWLGLVFAAFVVFSGLFIAKSGGLFPVLIALGVASVIVIISLAMRELSLMLADLSDAAVRLAAGAERDR